MKRSRINQAIREMETLIRKCGVQIPPFCKWTPQEWKEKGEECQEIRDNHLGWDITGTMAWDVLMRWGLR